MRSAGASAVLFFGRTLLAIIFLVAGAAKLVDRPGSRKALEGFGLPGLLAEPLSLALPLAELVIALLLLPLWSAWWAACAGFALLLIFVTAISVSMALGRAPDCHCFGQLHSEPVGWPTLLRNGLLTALAGFLVWTGRENPGPSVIGWTHDLSSREVVGGGMALIVLVVVAAEGWLVWQLMRQNGRLLIRMDALEARLSDGRAAERPAPQPPIGPPVGSLAPEFELPSLVGERVTLEILRAAAKPVLLFFTDPNCGSCNAMLPDVQRWQRENGDKLTIAIVSGGKPRLNRAKAEELGLTNFLLQNDREVAEKYQAHGSPSAVLIRPDGDLASYVAFGAQAIGELVAGATMVKPQAASRIAPANQPHRLKQVRIGQPAPSFVLPDVDSRQLSLSALRGRRTLLLFWNPGCGFCQKMLADLKAWERESTPAAAPQLVVVSTGSVEANRAMGLQGIVLLDSTGQVSGAFGAAGTPSAVLVDSENKIASQLAVGGQAVLALARTATTVAIASL